MVDLFNHILTPKKLEKLKPSFNGVKLRFDGTPGRGEKLGRGVGAAVLTQAQFTLRSCQGEVKKTQKLEQFVVVEQQQHFVKVKSRLICI